MNIEGSSRFSSPVWYRRVIQSFTVMKPHLEAGKIERLRLGHLKMSQSMCTSITAVFLPLFMLLLERVWTNRFSWMLNQRIKKISKVSSVKSVSKSNYSTLEQSDQSSFLTTMVRTKPRQTQTYSTNSSTQSTSRAILRPLTQLNTFGLKQSTTSKAWAFATLKRWNRKNSSKWWWRPAQWLPGKKWWEYATRTELLFSSFFKKTHKWIIELARLVHPGLANRTPR